MNSEAYKSFHELFVSNHKGTTLMEVTLISLVCPMSVLSLVKLEKYLKNSSKLSRLIIEYLILAGPLLVIFTNLFNSITAVLSFFILSLSSYFLLPQNNDAKDQNASLERPKLSFLTNYRASMLLVTSICILAVDFSAYPRRFAKTEELGFGVMDAGVGSFVFSAGIVAPTSPIKMSNNAQKCGPLFILGVLKYLSTRMVDYHNHVSEYGIHWNFFITMALVQLICGSLTCKLGANLKLCLGLGLAICHEIALTKWHYKWIFAFTLNQRLNSNLLFANIEGFVSLLGFAALFLLASSLRSCIYSMLQRKSNLVKAGVFVLLLCCIHIIFTNTELLVPPSRRLCNLSYIVWMIGYNLMLIILYASIQFITDFDTVSCLYQGIASNAMLFFLLANLMTGMVNVSIQAALFTDFAALFILIMYTMILCGVFCLKI